MTAETLEFGGAPHRLRGWLLFVLREAARQGMSPLGIETLHLLLFYGAVLTPAYGLDNPVPKILKYRDRPFYPEAQDELIGLIVGGFVDTRTRSGIKDDGWTSDRYAINDYGLQVAELLIGSRWGAETSRFVRDLVASFAEFDSVDANSLIDEDALFRQDRLQHGQVADLRTSNYAIEAARMVADYEVDGLRPGPRDSLALYFNFLQARRAA